MWYSKDAPKPEIDYNKPIVVTVDNIDCLLMPIHASGGSYDIIGYDWFNLTEGRWNSSITFKTPKDAVAAYIRDYNIKNVNINIS